MSKPTVNPKQKKFPTIVATITLLNFGIIGCSGGSAPAPKQKPEASENEASKEGTTTPGGGHPGSNDDPTLNNLGFHNFGASCYANAALKFLWATGIVSKAVAAPNRVQDSLFELLRKLNQPQSPIQNNHLDYFFSEFSDHLKGAGQTIGGINHVTDLKGNQQDSAEMFTQLYDIFEQDWEAQLGHFNRAEAISDPLEQKHFRPLNHLGEFEPTHEHQLDLFVGNPRIDSIQSAVDYEFHPSEIEWNHEKCTQSKFLLRADHHLLPQIFILKLSRFGFDQGTLRATKITKRIDVLKTISLPYFESIEGFNHHEQKLLPMRLKAGVVHAGHNANSGHYYAYILQRKPDGSEAWFLHNDSVVREVAEKTALDELSGRTTGGGQGYYFLYEKIKPHSH